jgi:hypothetical protein
MKEKKKKKKYRPLFRFCVGTLKLFSKKKKVEGAVQSEPCIYLCRHLDEKGVIDSFTCINAVMRPWVLDVFCDRKSATKHFKEYTFSQRLKKGKLFCALVSPFVGWGYSAIVKSARGIPVYRGEKSSQSVSTIKKSVRALEEGDNLLIYSDVDYLDKSDCSTGEIYTGFRLVDKMYYRRNKKHVPLVPVYIGENKVVIHEPLTIGENESEVIEKIRYNIYNEI